MDCIYIFFSTAIGSSNCCMFLPTWVSKHWYSPTSLPLKNTSTIIVTPPPFPVEPQQSIMLITLNRWVTHISPRECRLVGAKPFVNRRTVNRRQWVEPNEETCVRCHRSISNTHTVLINWLMIWTAVWQDREKLWRLSYLHLRHRKL